MSPSLRIHRHDSRYFEDGEGRTFVPVGLNLCFYRNEERSSEAEILEKYRFWMTRFAENGGNFIRIWLGVPFFNVMPEQFGFFSEQNLGHIRFVVQLAEELGLRIKFTMEHFRRILPAGGDTELFPGAVCFNAPLYARDNGGVCDDISEYFQSDAGRQAYLGKARYLAEAGLGNSPAVVAWELWNELNCVLGNDVINEWSSFMLRELRRLFPNQLVLTNLGSFSDPGAYRIYDSMAALGDNDFMQAHRYLDPGAQLDICRGSMDRLCADVIRELRDRRADRPAILAEAGAVEAHHASFSLLYENDSKGTLLHDMLFAPFFAGSAGSGQPWHWDYIYLEKHDLYWHFARFARAVEGIDPAAEGFVPYYTETPELRVYGLRGKTKSVAWCRDKKSDWVSELSAHRPAQKLSGLTIPAEDARRIRCYLPWEDRFVDGTVVKNEAELPDFSRSAVVYFER